MKFYHLVFKQKFPITINEAWDFFSSPINLAQITPKDMTFEITTDTAQQKMYAGMIITYRLSPFRGLTVNWMTEITQVSFGKYFIDEQRFGPYKFWHHQHHFEEIDGGVEMTDILTYGLPFGFLGRIAHEVYVKKKLEEIFEFRRMRGEELLGRITS